MTEAVGCGFKSRLQPEIFHVGIHFLSSSPSTFLPSLSKSGDKCSRCEAYKYLFNPIIETKQVNTL